MKAKRILSLLLTVAMIAACGVTAFAAPTGYDYVQSSTSQILSSEQTLYTGAAMPVLDGEGAIRADIVITPMTDADIAAAYECTPQDLGCPTDWTDAGYMVTVDLKNLGTLVAARTGATAVLYKYHGFKLVQALMNFSWTEGEVVCVRVMGSALDETLETFTGNGFVSDTEYKIGYKDAAAKTGYPTTLGTIENASVDGFASVLFFAEPGSVVTIGNGSVAYNNYKDSKATDANGEAWANTSVAYWHPATITLGEAEGGDDPVVVPEVGAVTGGTTGVAFTDGSDIYDNAYEVSASFSNADAITAAGVLFIPAAYYDGATLDKDTENVAIAEYVGNAAGEGTLTIRAALKGIPRGLVGKNDTVDMRVMPYLRVGDVYTYGGEATKTINVTEIAPEA